jgi:hypothetical protein
LGLALRAFAASAVNSSWNKPVTAKLRRAEALSLERKMNLQEERERTENEWVMKAPLLTQKVRGVGSVFRLNRLNLRFLRYLL